MLEQPLKIIGLVFSKVNEKSQHSSLQLFKYVSVTESGESKTSVIIATMAHQNSHVRLYMALALVSQ